MLLKQLIQQTSASTKLLFRDPFVRGDPEQLVKEVIGLANADAEGPRYIIFGVNLGAMEGSGVVGIAESAMADLKKGPPRDLAARATPSRAGVQIRQD